MAAVEVTGIGPLVRELTRLGTEVDDLKAVFSKLAAEGAATASSFAPKDTGHLRQSVRGNKAKNKAVVIAGSAVRVPYAGVQNYGWRERNIVPTKFMQRADEVMGRTAGRKLEEELNRLIRKVGLAT